MKELNYLEVGLLKSTLENINSKHFEAKDIMKLIDLQKKIENYVKDLETAKEKLFKGYKVETIEGNYNWEGHKNAEEISNKFKDLFESVLKIKKEDLNISSSEVLVKATSEIGYNIPQISKVIELLSDDS